MTSALRINMTGYNQDTALEAERYRQALEMAAFADSAGFDAINLEEHHSADNGWLASPLTMASMIAARTERARISVCALLITLYDPVRLAEDIAVIDVISRGRFSFIAGQGYRELEYHAVDKNWDDRGEAMDHCLQTLIKAWSGEPFDYKGETVRVSPTPVSRPHPMMLVGGMGKNAARRAARFGLPFYPPSKMPELEALYYAELDKQGKQGFVMCPDEDSSVLFIHQDPERAWRELGQHFLQEVKEYSSWKRAGIPRPLETDSESIAALRADGFFEIISPDQCLQRFNNKPDYTACLHPLVGGMPLDEAWNCLTLYKEQVLAPLRQSQA